MSTLQGAQSARNNVLMVATISNAAKTLHGLIGSMHVHGPTRMYDDRNYRIVMRLLGIASLPSFTECMNRRKPLSKCNAHAHHDSMAFR